MKYSQKERDHLKDYFEQYIKDHPVCEMCNRAPSIDPHHLFPKKFAILYPEYIHHEMNLIAVCRACHEKAGNISEQEFCDWFNIEPRSKSMQKIISHLVYN